MSPTLSSVTERYQEEMRKKIEEADKANERKCECVVSCSRQNYRDMLEAMRILGSMNPWHRSISRRLEEIAFTMRDSLDKAGAPDG